MALVVTVAAAGVPVAEADAADEPRAVFADGSGVLHVLRADGTTTSLGVSGNVVGPMRELDGDGRLEAPFVTSNGDLRLVDLGGETQTLVTGDVSTSVTYVAAADWDGDGVPAVVYANASDNGYIYRYEVGESGAPAQVTTSTQASAVVGVADFDGDGDDDLIFVGTSGELKYYDGSTVTSTGNSNMGEGGGLGVGPPVDLDGDGRARVPAAMNDATVALVNHTGGTETFDENYQSAAKAPVAVVDWTGNDSEGVVHVNSGDNTLHVVYPNGTQRGIDDASESAIAASTSVGVAPVLGTPGPAVSNFSMSNTGGRTLEVSFETTESLTDVRANVTGPATTALTEANFTESGSDPYRYNATWRAPADGDYTATLEAARDADGYDAADGQTATASVTAPTPTVTDAALVDRTDGDGVVGDGDRVHVMANVSATTNVTVTADASPLGAGTVTLSQCPCGNYTTTVTANASNATGGGEVRVTVTARNAYGNADSDESSAVGLDLSPPVAAIEGDDTSVEVGERVTFDATPSSDDTGVVRYRWDFGDGTTDTGATVTHTYDGTGTHEATVTVTDAVGHSDAAARTVTVTDGSGELGGPTSVEFGDGSDVESDSEGTGDSDGGDDDPMWVEVVRPDDERVRVAVGNARRGANVSERLPGPNTSEVPGGVVSLAFTTRRFGDVNVTVRPQERAPPGVPSVRDARGVEPVGYYVSRATWDRGLDRQRVTVAVPAEALGVRDADAVRVYRRNGSRWTATGARVVNRSGQTVSVAAPLAAFDTLAVGLLRADWRVVQTGVSDRRVRVGERVTVTATLANRGRANGTTTPALGVEGRTQGEQRVVAAAGERSRVEFTHTFASPGTYSVSVAGVDAGTVTVRERSPPTPAAPDRDVPWWLVLLALLVVVTAGVAAYRRRR